MRTPTGAIFTNVGLAEFALVTDSGAVAAYSQMIGGLGVAMTGTWTNHAGSFSRASLLRTSLLTIVVDLGRAPLTTGVGWSFVALGIGPYSGTTAPLAPV